MRERIGRRRGNSDYRRLGDFDEVGLTRDEVVKARKKAARTPAHVEYHRGLAHGDGRR